jgi:hypothetical protein
MLTIEPGILGGRVTPVDHDDVNVHHAPLELAALNELRAQSV